MKGGLLYDHFRERENLRLDNDYDTHTDSENHEESGYSLDLNMLIKHLILIVCFTSREKVGYIDR